MNYDDEIKTSNVFQGADVGHYIYELIQNPINPLTRFARAELLFGNNTRETDLYQTVIELNVDKLIA